LDLTAPASLRISRVDNGPPSDARRPLNSLGFVETVAARLRELDYKPEGAITERVGAEGGR
jgi:hypothetical protein